MASLSSNTVSPLIMRILAASVSVSYMAGSIIREILKAGDLGIVEKGKNDLQTEADRAAQDVLWLHFTDSSQKLPFLERSLDPADTILEDFIVKELSQDVLSQACPDIYKNVSDDQVGLLDHVTVLIGIAVNGEAKGGVIYQPYYNYQAGSDADLGRCIWGLIGLGSFGFTLKSPPANKNVITTTRSHADWIVTEAVNACEPTDIVKVGGAGHKMLVRHKQQFVELLSDIGFIQTGIRVRDLQRTAHVGSDGVAAVTGIEANENSNNWDLISAILLAALYPNIAVKPSGLGALTFLIRGLNATSFNTRDRTAQIHPSSVTFKVQTFSHPFLVYHEKVKTKRVYIRDCSEVPALALLLFGGGKVLVEKRGFHTLLLMDNGWIKLKFSSVKTTETLLALRKELNQLLSVKMANPDTDLVASERGSRVIRCIVDLVSAQSRSSSAGLQDTDVRDHDLAALMYL